MFLFTGMEGDVGQRQRLNESDEEGKERICGRRKSEGGRRKRATCCQQGFHCGPWIDWAIAANTSLFGLTVSSWLNMKEQRYGGWGDRERGAAPRWGWGQREMKRNIVSEKEKSQHLQKGSAGYFTVAPLRHKAQYDLRMTEVKEGWWRSRERRTKIDQQGLMRPLDH